MQLGERVEIGGVDSGGDTVRAMPRLDVRLLSAVDMHGAAGNTVRRWVIVAEFVLGAIVGTGFGIAGAGTAEAPGWTLFGIWFAGACLNYVPLALHALSLLPRGRLEAELDGVDIRAQLRYYTKAQLWIAVPLLLVVLAVMQRRSERARGSR